MCRAFYQLPVWICSWYLEPQNNNRGGMTMATIEKSVDVNMPLRTVYNQWTQFEEFPKFMEGVTQVRQLDDKRLHWKAEIAGQEREWDAEIYEQVPDQRIAWRSISGKNNAGIVTFQSLGADKTRINLRIE